MKKAEKMNVSDRVMVLEYIGKHFRIIQSREKEI